MNKTRVIKIPCRKVNIKEQEKFITLVNVKRV